VRQWQVERVDSIGLQGMVRKCEVCVCGGGGHASRGPKGGARESSFQKAHDPWGVELDGQCR
jgi:hypothetical protein